MVPESRLSVQPAGVARPQRAPLRLAVARPGARWARALELLLPEPVRVPGRPLLLAREQRGHEVRAVADEQLLRLHARPRVPHLCVQRQLDAAVARRHDAQLTQDALPRRPPAAPEQRQARAVQLQRIRVALRAQQAERGVAAGGVPPLPRAGVCQALVVER